MDLNIKDCIVFIKSSSKFLVCILNTADSSLYTMQIPIISFLTLGKYDFVNKDIFIKF